MKQIHIAALSSLFLFALAGCAQEDFGSPEPIEGALTGQLYFLPENTQKLPDFTQLEPQGTVYTTNLNIAPRNFEEGFPEVTDRFEWFGLQYKGTLHIKTAGVYTFALSSDDGAKLYIGPQLVVDNDFHHNARRSSGTIQLEAGDYPLTLEYFQGPRYEIALQLFVTPPGQAEQIFDSTLAY